MDRKIEKKKYPPKRIATLVMVFSLTFALVYMLLSAKETAHKVEADRVSIKSVVFGDFQEMIPASGTVEPLKTIMINASEGGRVDEVFVDDGATVEKDQPLAKLSNSGLMLDFMNRETQIIEQINNLRNTRISLQQNQRNTQDQLLDIESELVKVKRQYEADTVLSNNEVISEIDYFKSKTQYEYLQKKYGLTQLRVAEDNKYRMKQMRQIDASIDLMNRNLEAIRKNLESLVVKAPMDGQLNSFNLEIGENRLKGQNIGRVDQIDSFKVTAFLDQYYLNRVKIGQKAAFDYGGSLYTVAINKVSPTVVGTQFEIEMAFENRMPKNLTRGQQFQMRISLSALTQTVLVPKGSFYQSTGGAWIYVLNKEMVAEKRPIKLGRQNTEFIEVLEGLEDGDQVITSSYETFLDAERVRITE